MVDGETRDEGSPLSREKAASRYEVPPGRPVLEGGRGSPSYREKRAEATRMTTGREREGVFLLTREITAVP